MNMRGLDEMTEKELRDEIKRRLFLRWIELCDYCQRRPDTAPCQFPDRHRIKRGLHTRWEIKRPKDMPK